LLSALERAALVTEEKVAGSTRTHVKLDIRGNALKISANSSTGSTYDEMFIKHEGEDLLIAFNNRYLTDSIRAANTERIKISLSTPLSSINIEPVYEEGEETAEEDLFMLLPVKMKD
jgi:DNA polymerase-3 subunit beta